MGIMDKAKEAAAAARDAAARRSEGKAPTAATPDEGGQGTFGDGITAPLYEFQASRFKGGRLFSPNMIRIWPDRVEEHEPHAVRKTGTQAISLQQIAQVSMARGIVWSEITVESTGGHIVKLIGVPNADGDRIKQLLDEAVLSVRATSGPPAASGAVDVADQLRKLADLRDQGILSEEEFTAQKARLLQ